MKLLTCDFEGLVIDSSELFEEKVRDALGGTSHGGVRRNEVLGLQEGGPAPKGEAEWKGMIEILITRRRVRIDWRWETG